MITRHDRPVIACIADGDSGRALARIAAVLARRLEAPLLLTTVRQPTARAEALPDAEAALVAAARGLDPPPELHVAVGEPSERLLAIADRELAQLVVMAIPRGSSPRPLGNVHLALARAAPCPVVVVAPDVTL